MSLRLRAVTVSAGAILLVVAAVGAFQVSRFIAGALRSDGTVTRLNAGSSHPQIAFHTQNGSLISYPQGGMVAGFRVGQAVQVFYDAGDPSGTARVRSFGSLWGTSLVLATCGAVLLTLGLVSLSLPVEFYPKGR